MNIWTGNSNSQEMGETREPMAMDCWTDAQSLSEKYAKQLKHDFWVVYAAKPHVSIPNAIVCGWEVIVRRPPAAIVGAMVFKWDNTERKLTVEKDLCLPWDAPIEEEVLSKSEKDFVPEVYEAAKKSGSILLA